MAKHLAISAVETCPQAEAARDILSERISEITLGDHWAQETLALRFLDAKTDGFALSIRGGEATLKASLKREFIAGAGKLLSLLRSCAQDAKRLPDGRGENLPWYPVRLHYMPGHFGNCFEVAWPDRMRRYLEDLALWGASGYGDWFDPNSQPDPYNPHTYCTTSMTLWQRKKEVLRIAKTLGLDTALWVAHNVGFVDQLRPEWLGVQSHELKVQGQVLCPSIPEARNVCMQNHENLFRDLVESGVEVDKIIYGPYDDGGCACDKCQPYYPTFLKMVGEIHEMARRYFPRIKADFCGWWLTDEEIGRLKTFAAGSAREWFGAFQYSLGYDAFELGDVRKTLGDLPLSTFFHIGYSHDRRDVYMTTGIHSAPRRIQSFIRSFEAQNCLGFNSYNETFADHFNAFLATRIARNPDEDIRELAMDYCRQMYSVSGPDAQEMADVLQEIENLEAEKARGWLATLRRLRPRVKLPPRQPWAFDHVAIKAELMALDHRIGTGESWKSQKDIEPVLPLIKERLALNETLWSDVYRLGILSHCFIPQRLMPDWHERYITFL